jgi:hypothetical protein
MRAAARSSAQQRAADTCGTHARAAPARPSQQPTAVPLTPSTFNYAAGVGALPAPLLGACDVLRLDPPILNQEPVALASTPTACALRGGRARRACAVPVKCYERRSI